jgi:hypothetical protein
LSILAYTLNPVQAVKVLDVDDQDPTNTSFRIDLENEGKHLLMATATWSPFFSGDDQNNYISAMLHMCGQQILYESGFPSIETFASFPF